MKQHPNGFPLPLILAFYNLSSLGFLVAGIMGQLGRKRRDVVGLHYISLRNLGSEFTLSDNNIKSSCC